MKNNIEIIALIYKSTQYLEFITEQMKSRLCKVPGWDVHLRVIANDPLEEVKKALPFTGVPFDIYHDPDPNAYYINRVYRCHNYGAITSKFDNICFVNSDILFSPDWLANLLRHHDGVNIPVSRLIESGKMPSGQYGISANFGTHPKNIDYALWEVCSEEAKQDIIMDGGLYGPVVFEKQRFIDAGMYPEGNLYADGVGTLNGDVVKSSDDFFFHDVLEKLFDMKHITVFDSVCYHIQEGEKSIDD